MVQRKRFAATLIPFAASKNAGGIHQGQKVLD